MRPSSASTARVTKGAVFLAAHKSAVLGEAVFWSAPFALVQYSVFICVDKPDETGNIHLVAGFALRSLCR